MVQPRCSPDASSPGFTVNRFSHASQADGASFVDSRMCLAAGLLRVRELVGLPAVRRFALGLRV